jgi:cell division protein FtsB
METLPIDLVPLVAAGMGLLLVLIPVLGLAVRFAAGPLAEALVASKGEGARPADLQALKMRIEALEHEVQELSTGLAPGSAAPREQRPVPLRP